MRRGITMVTVLGACQGVYGVKPGNPPADATQDADTPGTCETALICDHFEGRNLDPRWTASGFHGSAGLDTMEHLGGSSSLRGQIDEITANDVSNAGGVIQTGSGFPLDGTIYARVWAYVPFDPGLAPAPYEQVLVVMSGPEAGVGFGFDDHGHVVDNQFGDAATNRFVTSPTIQIPPEMWTCLQLEVPSNVVGDTRLFVSGSNAGVDIEGTMGVAHPQAVAFTLGVGGGEDIQNEDHVDLWLDDLIVDTRPTTCEE